MSDLIALSFDADATPAMRFGGAGPPESGAPYRPAVYGWGIGWYPDSERGASVLKDPTSSGEGGVSHALSDWRRFRSTLYVGHLRGHTRKRAQQDAQPFVRSYGGRQWIFAHDGDLVPDYAERLPLGNDPSFEPLGWTDSEHAFCWILSQLRARHYRGIADVPPEEVRGWFTQLNELGRVNALLTDGDLLVVYRDAQLRGELYWTRRIPPHPTTHLESDALVIDLDSPEDPNRTGLVFSSVRLTRDSWLSMSGSQLLLARRGSVVWDSDPQESLAPGGPAGPAGTATRSEASPQIAAVEPLASVSRAGEAHSPRSRILQIEHETRYHYNMPVERSSHRILLRPVENRLQSLESFVLEIEPAGGISAEYEDVFGNAALSLEFSRPYLQLTIRSRARVHTLAPESLESRASRRRETIPLVWMPWQRQMLAAYLLPPELPETQLHELSDFAMAFVDRNDQDLVGTLLDMNETLYRDFEYLSGSTTIATTPFEVFESRRGVCQDFANLMICLARLLNVPARYRMGYIFTGADYVNQVQSEASHAWVELYLPRVGWAGFDPTNGRRVGSEHVRVACGRNYRDATPTSGTIYRGGGMETLTIQVRVEDVTPLTEGG